MLKALLFALLLSAAPANIDWKVSAEGGRIVLTGDAESGIDHVSGTVSTISCEGNACNMPQEFEFDVTLDGKQAAAEFVQEAAVTESSSEKEEDRGLWGLILEAVLWGFLMLLTPCVFPMVPMTVSYFLKGSSNKAAGRLRAFLYGIFIVLLYTVPICLLIGATYLFGGDSVTSDIFNWLSTHWLPNIIFFVVFMVFAASFFGAFEITLPSKWANAADKGSDRKGLAGVFFLALTLVLVSFSCTGPIVGTVLIKSTQGEFWTPMITMLAFSIAFALPFSLLALFPSVLKKLPKSGAWLGSVKVVLGFIEVALGLKFLSVADQTYHWGILDREVYLAIWIAVFILLALYLLGKITLKQEEKLERIGLGRLLLALIDIAFVVYLVPGMWGAPLKALSGYLPPLETQDFVVDRMPGSVSDVESEPLGRVYSLEEGLAIAARENKLVFVDITGHGCVNCREMEARVWSDPSVSRILRDEYVIVALYVDDKTKLPESEWVETPNGAVLKDVGRVNAYLATKKFGVNSQPNYFVMDSDGNILKGPYAYNLDIQKFIEFLK